MSLTVDEKKELVSVLSRTNGFRDTAKKQRVVPGEYKAWQSQVEQKEITLPLSSAGVPVRCVITTAKDKTPFCPVHINMHGGGFVFPQDTDDDLYCARVAAGIHGIVVDIDYAVSTDHPFPTAFDQCYAVTQWVFSQCETWGVDSNRVSIGGHSAGGCLSAAISLKAAVTKDFKLCLQILDYAALDNFKAVLQDGEERSRAFSMLYVDGDTRVLKTPYCSPAFASDAMLKDQPRTLVISAGSCPFMKVNEDYAMRLAAMGNEVTIRRFLQSRHGFTVRIMDEWDESQKLIIRTINTASCR